jgi:hypothetical protein
MINYEEIRNIINKIVNNRNGMPPKFETDVAGIFCSVGYEHNISGELIVDYLKKVMNHRLKPISMNGKLNEISDLINDEILYHKSDLFKLTEKFLVLCKPGNVQAGPGEFFFCFYDEGSTFGVSPTLTYDVIVNDNKSIEMKKLGSNLENPDKFNHYGSIPGLHLLVIKPISFKSINPKVRTQYICGLAKDWSNFVSFKDNPNPDKGKEKRLTLAA